jgi:hypothetical protein
MFWKEMLMYGKWYFVMFAFVDVGFLIMVIFAEKVINRYSNDWECEK